MSQVVKRVGVLSFSKCVNMMQGRPSPRRKLGPNTYLEVHAPDEFRVILYGTVIMQLTADGAIRLFSGDQKTPTTKQRLNALSPRGVYQKGYEWFVGTPGLPFCEGINVGAPQTPREAIMADIWAGKMPVSVLADYDADHAPAIKTG
jgi:hypothetical protein